MLLPDNINPEDTLYFNGAIVLKNLKENGNSDIIDLYEIVKNELNISFSLYILCLDWLFLVNLAEINKNNLLESCI